MAFKRLGPIVKQVVSRLVIDAGEGSGGTLPDAVNGSKRGPDAETPGQVLRRNIVDETTQPGKAPASSAEGRGRATHHTAPPQRRVARPMLSVIEGGGGRRQEGEASAAYAQLPGGSSRSNLFVISNGHSTLANSR